MEKKDRVIVWGAGRFGREFINRKNSELSLYDFEIEAFADNDQSRWGETFCNYPIIPPEEIGNRRCDLLVMACSSHKEVEPQLRNELNYTGRIEWFTDYLHQVYARRTYERFYEHRKKGPAWGVGKLVVYTANFGGYDYLADPQCDVPGIDYVCFTDNRELKSDRWNLEYVDKPEMENSSLNARKIKVHPHHYFKDYDISIWLDSNATITGDFRTYIKKYTGSSNLLCLPHSCRDCTYTEGQACIEAGVKGCEHIEEQLSEYRRKGLPEHAGLICSACLVRRHNSQDVIRVMEDWWQEIGRFSIRDQVSFEYACWKNQFVYDLSDIDHYRNPFYYVRDHKVNVTGRHVPV